MTAKCKISAVQFFTLLFVSRLSLTMLYDSRVSGIENLGQLLPSLLLMLPAGILLVLPLLYWTHLHPRISLFEYAVDLFPHAGKALSAFYGIFCVIAAGFIISDLFGLTEALLPQGINSTFLLIILVLACIYGASRGLESIARLSLLILVLLAICAVLLFVFLTSAFSSMNLPEKPDSSQLFQGIMFLSSRLPLFSVLAVLSPNIKGNIIRSGLVFRFIISLVLFVLVLFLGGAGGYYLQRQSYPVFHAIDLSGPLQSLDPVYILSMICSAFCGITLLMIASGKSLSFCSSSKHTRYYLSGAALLLIVMFVREFRIISPAVRSIILSTGSIVFLTFIPLLFLIRERSGAGKPLRRRLLSLLLIMSFVICQCGCNAVQLNRRIILQGLGIDKAQSGYKLTLIVLDVSDPEQQNRSSVIRSEGETVESALVSLEQERGKKILYNKCLFILMNTSASTDPDGSLDYLSSSYELSRTTELLKTNQSAGMIIETALENGYTAEDIGLIYSNTENSLSCNTCTVLDYLSSDSSVPILNIRWDNNISALVTER